MLIDNYYHTGDSVQGARLGSDRKRRIVTGSLRFTSGRNPNEPLESSHWTLARKTESQRRLRLCQDGTRC